MRAIGRSKSVVREGEPGEASRLAIVTPWYARCREMIFFFCGRPSALFTYQASLIAVSFASDPEFANSAAAHARGRDADQSLPRARVLIAGTLPAKL